MIASEKSVKVAVENCKYCFDELFTFLIPDNLADNIIKGQRVLVPFGKGNVKRQGFVFEICDNTDSLENLKYIDSIIDFEPLLSDELIKLAVWLKETCFCTYYVAAKALLPAGMCVKTEKAYKLTQKGLEVTFDDFKLESIRNYLLKKDDYVREKFIIKKYCLENNPEVLLFLEKNGYIESEKGVYSKLNCATVKTVRLSDKFIACENAFKLTEKQATAVEYVKNSMSDVTIHDLTYYTGISSDVVKRLVGKGIFELLEFEYFRSCIKPKNEPGNKNVLSDLQKKAYFALLNEYEKHSPQTALLFGVTGSGKTSVYLELIDRVLEDNKSALVLVPEISLTPQTISLFSARYGSQIAVIHSALSTNERYDEWRRIKNGDAKVVIGTRSAIFAPLKNIGVIIIDEEQEHTYKSESSPRYNAKDVARFRCAYNNSLLILASATPSVETYAKAVSGKYTLCELDKRYGKAILPEVITVDITEKEQLNSFSAISQLLTDEIQDNLDKKEQTILLINRRGYNTFVACRACKHVVTCPKCSISLTYHSANNRLMCHYCGYSVEYTDICPKCGEHNIRYSGFGTQRVEQELQIKFPSARILRMDADTTSAKDAHDKAFSAFAAGEYDILLGTQMVAKGLDFPNVTLVGITSADMELYNDDFRSNERSFDLVTQVIGRAGRGNKKGRAVIQTLSPESKILDTAAKQDYKAFYKNEIIMRKAMIYPPFCDICVIGFSSLSERLTSACASEFFSLLRAASELNPQLHLIVLGPLSPRVSKINDNYRQRIIIKCKNSVEFRKMISDLLKKTELDKKYKNVSIYADINPENTD